MRKYEKMIFDIIYKKPRHLTAEDIYKELKEQEPKVVLATVYNNLNVLYEKKLIHKVIVAGMPDRYDSIERHDHLVCSKCGQLRDFKFKDLTHDLEEQLGVQLQGYELNVTYLCPKCRKAEQK